MLAPLSSPWRFQHEGPHRRRGMAWCPELAGTPHNKEQLHT
jgi:hypothetical protein